MDTLYGSAAMAAGYARWRPAVHPRVVARIRERLAITAKVRRAVDVGCGAGLSTAALDAIALQCVGLEPVEAMLGWARVAAPNAVVAAARAEELPIATGSADLITAAGSLNYVNLELFFPEARRVLTPGGHLVVYDFGPGRAFGESPALSEWYDEFERRYPVPPCREILPLDLPAGRHGFSRAGQEGFETRLTLAPDFYLEYAMTETSVASAIRGGVAEGEIRQWCEGTLGPVFGGAAREVIFKGYVAWLS